MTCVIKGTVVSDNGSGNKRQVTGCELVHGLFGRHKPATKQAMDMLASCHLACLAMIVVWNDIALKTA